MNDNQTILTPDTQPNGNAGSLCVQRFVRPRPGDTWEIKIPNRPKKVKRIGSIRRIWIRSKDGRGENGNIKLFWIQWQRLPKGRYSGITLKGLIKFGRLIESNTDRMARDEAKRKRVDAKWSNAGDDADRTKGVNCKPLCE